MPDSRNPTPQNTQITVTFSAPELSQLEIFAALHGESVAAFVQRVALEAVHMASIRQSARGSTGDTGALWLSEDFAGAPELKDEEVPDLFTLFDAGKEPETVAIAPVAAPAPAPAPKRGVAGEQSRLAKGRGPVWEIRQALGRERVHGLGWTREQLAFVLKLSVVGVRKMEHLGTAPVKSLEGRRALLNLAKTLEKPGAEIAAYIEREDTALG